MLITSQNSFAEGGTRGSEEGKSRAEDLHLVEKASTGDRDAFEVIYRKYQNRIYGLCLRLTTDRVEAEELTLSLRYSSFANLATELLHELRGRMMTDSPEQCAWWVEAALLSVATFDTAEDIDTAQTAINGAIRTGAYA